MISMAAAEFPKPAQFGQAFLFAQRSWQTRQAERSLNRPD